MTSMDRSNSVKNNTLTLPQLARRAAAMLCAALAGLALAGRAAAQATGPLPASPSQPTPYQSPLFHNGGAQDPLPAGVPSLFLDSRLQGTPSGLIGGVPTQIPSYLLGNYDPNNPPTTAGVHYPEHFADGQDPPFGWNAPFDYVPQSVGLQSEDDNDTTAPTSGPPATAGFTATSGWQQVTVDGANGSIASPAAGTATNAEYLRLPAGTDGTATWQLVEPVAGSYTVNVNLPNDLPDINGNPEPRSTDVTYFITVRDAGGVITFSGNATISQTEANANQFLAGPFQIVAGGSVTVTLPRNVATGFNNDPKNPYFLVADSMTLQVAVGDVQSTPTVINTESYPEDFKRAQYWGISVPDPGAPPLTVKTTVADNAPPDVNGTTPILHSGDPAKAGIQSGAVDPRRRIRQLVYFGRREPVYARSVTLDDSQTGFGNPGGAGPVNDASATNGEYRRYGVSAGGYTATSTPVASWLLTVPTAVSATGYFINVHLPRTPQAGQPNAPENRLGRVTYTVTDAANNAVISGPVTISQRTFGTDLIVTLPTGALTLDPVKYPKIKVNLFSLTGTNGAPGANTYVVADSVSLTTGNGQGAIYCVDGFTGGVVWRYETPNTPNAGSAPVYSSPAVAKINVLVTPATATAPAIYANKLVVIVGDNNGLVYCLDAIGNGDGTSNANAIDPTSSQPIYGAQPGYGTTAPAFDPLNPHIGTTSEYWIYRPDPNLPKYVSGANAGAVKPQFAFDVSSDLPVPAAFNTASPTLFVDPNVPTTPDATGTIPAYNGAPPSNATVYVGNSNGVLYALDALGVATGGDTQAAFDASGEKFNGSLDVRRSAGHFKFLADGTTPDPQFDPTDGFAPTPQPKWWFTLRGADPNSPDNPSFADIESAPALYIATTVTSVTLAGGATTTTNIYAPTVYIGSAHEMEATSNIGRLYALNGLYGPAGNNGRSDPSTAAGAPGSFNYNIGQRPQINNADATDWAFPDAYDRTGTDVTKNNHGQSSDKRPRPALGNITGSPVVFTNATNFNGITHETNTARQTRIYFAANSGLETITAGRKAATRPDEAQTGRIWAVNLDGSVGTTTNSARGVWAFPAANDPNNAANDTVVEPSPPMGAFLHATPAMGFVQFPTTITNGDSSTYAPTDVINTGANGIKGQSVPMLYVATRGVNDTALYAIDVDGGSDAQRLIYRQPSPDSAIFQSSPVLITNASVQGGNGGSVFVTGGSSFYDYSATPVSNPIVGQAFPLIRLNKTYTTFGPFSSPAVSATDTSDELTTAELNAYKAATGRTTTVTDWVYVGDSTSGLCRGFTPRDGADAGIPADAFNAAIPPYVNPPTATDLSAPLQAYLVDETHKKSINYSDRLPFGKDASGNLAPLPVYEWGQNVYIRFANAVPPGTDLTKIVYDQSSQTTPAEGTIGYLQGGALEFDLSDATQGANGTAVNQADHKVIPPVLITVPGNNSPLPNGFIQRADTDTVNVLRDASGKQYIGAYTYTIADGSALLNTPGSRRQVINATQTVEAYKFTGGRWSDQGRTKLVAFISNGNEVTRNTGTAAAPSYVLSKVPPIDQPTFGILNPLAVRGGGTDLFGKNNGAAVPMGDTLGPFRGIANTTGTISNDPYDLKALANGNEIPQAPPPSSAGGGGIINPIKPLNDVANAAFFPPTIPNVVVTATGLIRHNDSGDNADATAQAMPPSGSVNFNTNDGLKVPTGLPPGSLPIANFGSTFAPYALDLGDRSALGLIAQGLRAKANTTSGGGDAGLYWNDNTANATGHDSVVNFLPWETAPPVGSFLNGSTNSSQDYPNISPSNISVILHPYNGGAADMTLGQANLTRAVAGTSSAGTNTDVVRTRTVYANPVQFHVSVQRFQSANQQLYREFPKFPNQPVSPTSSNYDLSGQISPADLTTNANNTFPMGYVTTRRIYVPNRNGFYRNGAAFREVRVYTGVPPDYGIQMADATVAEGPVPSGFGIQTSHDGSLNPTNPLDPTSPLGTFNPYNLLFQDYFQPLTIHNTGNVNLLNVHLDQKQLRPINGIPTPVALPLVSDALDNTSFIPGYDYQDITGARFGRFGANNTPEQSYLIRSSLDTDLVIPYGHNPYIVKDPNTGATHLDVYPGATFHKAQVGSAQPSALSVPDAPDSFTPGATLDVAPVNPQTKAANPYPTLQADPNNYGLPYKTAPFVSAAIPFGTPVGSYHGLLQAFEGVDPTGYSTVAAGNDPGSVKQGPYALQGAFSGLTRLIFPPRYGGAVGGIGTPNPNNPLPDTILSTQGGSDATGAPNPAVSLMPNSTPTATVLNVKVVEDRMTDGATYGGVPMVDQPPLPNNTPPYTPPPAVPDFAPAAYRDKNSGNLSVYWTSGRGARTSANAQFNIYQALVPMVNGAFLPVNPAATNTYVPQWWTSLANDSAGYTGTYPFRTLNPALAANAGTNSGLTIAQDAQNLGTVYAFGVNVQAPPLPGVSAYQNTLLCYPVTASTGALGSAQPITNDPTQVKYGVKGLSCLPSPGQPQIFTRNLWAFWTATTRGRTAIYYNSQDPTTNLWVPAGGSNTPSTIGLLPIPAGLTAVADPAPLLVFGNVLVNGTPQLQATIEVTYSGTAPDGNVDLYQSRYQPDGAPTNPKPYQLDLVPFPAVTEILTATGQPGGWYQARDVAWSRTSQLNLFVGGQPILYDTSVTPAKPLFSRAVFDKASGLLVLTGIQNRVISSAPTTIYAFANTAPTGTVTAYVDLATGRVRFTATPNATVTAFFSPLARRITNDSRADTGPITFLDGNYKVNAAAPYLNGVKADRRWYVWRKSGAGGATPSASLYYKTQRLTLFLPSPIGISIPSSGNPATLLLKSVIVNGTDVTPYVDVDYARGRIYFPIDANGTITEGQTATVTYAPANTVTATNTQGNNITTASDTLHTIQWQDEEHTGGAPPPTDTPTGLSAVTDTLLPIAQVVNENNVSAFLDTDAYNNYYTSPTNFNLSYPHKVWLFWNSTRNGTADLYYETINPLFTAGP